MNVVFFSRKFNPKQISIEKLFDVVRANLCKRNVEVRDVQNPFPLWRMLSAMWFFRKNQGEINHITGDIHWASLLLDSRRTVLTIHDLVGLQNLSGIKRFIYFQLWVNLPIRKLKYITVISEKTKQEILQEIPNVEDKIKVIPNCLTIPLADEIRERKNTIPKILLVGTRSNKNIERVFEAVRDLRVELYLVGELSNTQLDVLNKYNLLFRNFISVSEEELISLYDVCDILCFPSLYEGFGLPILEAQARGCVVITSDLSPMREVVGKGGILVNPNYVLDIKNAIELVLKDKILRLELQLQGRENVEQYLPEKVVEQYIKLYESIKI